MNSKIILKIIIFLISLLSISTQSIKFQQPSKISSRLTQETKDPQSQSKPNSESQPNSQSQNNPQANSETDDDDFDDNSNQKPTDNTQTTQNSQKDPFQPDISTVYKIQSTRIQIGEYKKIEHQFKKEIDDYQPVAFNYFVVDKKLSSDKEITIMVNGRADYSHSPLLIISTQNQYPDLSSQNDIFCGFKGVDFCSINSQDIIENHAYYIGIFCQKSCRFSIQVIYETTSTLKLGEVSRYVFPDDGKAQHMVAYIEVEESSSNSNAYEHVLIESYLLNALDVNGSFHIYVKKGDSIPNPSDYDYNSEELMLNGLAVLIEDKGKILNKSKQIYTIAISAPSGSQIILQSEGFGKTRQIYLNKETQDMVQQQQMRIFALYFNLFSVFELDNDQLSIDLTPFFGNPDLYIAVNQLPDDPTNLSSYKFSSTSKDGIESLTISKDSIKNLNMIDDVIYIVVFGETASSFSLIAYSSNYYDRGLDFDIVESGYLQNSGIISYQLFIQKLNNDTQITVQATAISGSMNLYIRECLVTSVFEDCLITDKEINEEKLLQKSIENQKDHKLTIDYNIDRCRDEKGNMSCLYTVAIQGKGKGESHYKLMAKRPKQQIQLVENQNYRGMMDINTQDYYKFNLNNIIQNTVHKVVFHFVPITGYITVFSSRQKPFPQDIDNSEDLYSISEDAIVYQAKQNSQEGLKGSFYISVLSQSACIYNIYVKVYRRENDGQIQSVMKEIDFGTVEKGYVMYNIPESFYFNINKRTDVIEEITIMVYFSIFKDSVMANNIKLKPNLDLKFLESSQQQNEQQTLIDIPSIKNNDYLASDFVYKKFKLLEKGKKGLYMILLNHTNQSMKQYQIQFSINLNAKDITYIIPRGGYISDVSLQSNDKYEMYLSEPAQIYLEVFECLGQVQIRASDSFSKAENDEFNVKSKPSMIIGDHTIVNFERKQKGPLFITVQPLLGVQYLNQTKALYMIIPHIMPQNQVIPHQVYQIPSNGQINASVKENFNIELQQYSNTINIFFGTIQCANQCIDSLYNAIEYQYTVHLTNKQQYLQYFAKCELEQELLNSLGLNTTNLVYAQSQKIFNQGVQPFNHTFQFIDLPNGTYYVEIQGVVYLQQPNNLKYMEPFSFIYPFQQITVGSDQIFKNVTKIIETHTFEKTYIFPLWIMVIIGILLCLLIIICIYKQVKMFIIRRNYRIAMARIDKEEGQIENENNGDNINDDDEKQKNIDKKKLNQ
ncbi:hypothetical protein IMG5_177900 [Ichthyophthirius multifiliis]|uniref:Transmembrane protein n=1 Tax=Ichthyophthirius multifiliis TaxID=5932 RepID=G0R2G2_ICHMU|nr:hypothetical protein IMG5_177900 [Ichthyophthirius multifiliis]EGR28330.1 hypothetical protein IMG5_177900 [Ichthyophthirius multifiliis]|eukprot:XP_004027675.1 hypothetical protein IMG5_177900 [Ichthyophthirius multifiliis]